MSYISIPTSKRAVGKPVDKDLVDNIHFNLEDLNTRLASISIAAGSAILVNKAEKKAKDALPVGSIVYGSLTDTQFASEADSGEWVYANGASVVGSDWSTLTGRTALPDVRGRFLRAKDNASGNNSSGDFALDEYTADVLKIHLHDMGHAHGHSITANSALSGIHAHALAVTSSSITPLKVYDPLTAGNEHYLSTTNPVGNSSNYYLTGDSGTPTKGITAFDSGHTHPINIFGSVTNMTGNTGSTGASETAPRYITENAFIKINRAYINTDTRLFIIRVPQQTTLNNILLSPVSQGTSGNLIIDIKKGPTIATATQSIFQSGNLPTLAWNGTAGVTGLTNSAQNTVAAGQFVVVSVTSTQAKLREFHLFISGDY